MKRIITSGFLLISLVFIYGCGGGAKEGETKVVETNFGEGIIDRQQNLVFVFDQEVANDSVLDQWDSIKFVKFTPEVRGQFKWTTKNELVFSPDFGFRPSTDYKAELTEEIKKFSGDKYDVAEPTKFEFHTPYLSLSEVETFWHMNRETATVKVRMGLNFNLKIDPKQLKDLLSISYNGKNLKYDLKTSSPASSVELQFDPVKEKGFDGGEVKVVINAGLKCQESDYKTKEKIEITTKIPYKDKFNITNIFSSFRDGKGSIEVHTNQAVAEQNIKTLVSFNPSVEFKVKPTGYGFYITGDFKSDKPYMMRVSKRLKGIFGSSMKQRFEQYVTFGQLDPSISFENTRDIYLTSAGKKNLAMRITNIPKVNVEVWKIYENNIFQFLKRSGGYNNYYDEYYDDYYYDDYYYGYGSQDFSDIGDVVYSREIETSNLQKNSSGISLLNLNFNDVSPHKGIYFIKVSSTEDRWIKATNTVSISDVGLIVKQSDDQVLVYANSIMDAKPKAGVDVHLISSNNQTVYQAKTNAEGIAEFSNVSTVAKDFKISMVTAREGEDFTYVNFRQTTVDQSGFEIGGTRPNSAGYQAFLYGDRNLYRPGETVYSNVIVRDMKWNPVGDMPVKMKFMYPNGKLFRTAKGKLNSEGAFETSFDLPTATVTGGYTLYLYTSNDVLLGSRYLSVEEFTPDRIKVGVSLDKEGYDLGQEVKITAKATNLFGPPAANRNFEMDLQLHKKYFYAKDFPGWNFYINNKKYSRFDNELMEGKTDEDGRAVRTYTLPKSYQNHGLLQGTVYTTVFDESGRPVNRVNKFEVATQKTFFGIKNFDYYVGTDKTLKIPLIALSRAGKVQSDIEANLQIIKYEWHTVLKKLSGGKYRYVSQRKEKVLIDRKLRVNGKNTFVNFVPQGSGRYEVRIKKPWTDSYVSRYFYAYKWGQTTNTSFEVDKDGEILIDFDKETYNVGDKAKILFNAPFKGKLLVTVERDKVYEDFYLETDKKSAELVLPIKEEYLPNIYVSATLIKPHSNGAIPLTVAHGFKSVTVENAPVHKLPVTITAPKKVRSKTKQKICVKSSPDKDIQVTIAVVDEGILQIKNYQSPDPYAFFFQKRALLVNSYDIYPRLYPEVSFSGSRFGAGDYDLEKRVNPMTNKRVKLVAFWSGILKTDSRGNACYTIDVPQFSGDLRIMAVAYKGRAFGSASTNMKVADPIVLTTSLPRFLSPKDTVEVPVTLSNTTKKNTNASVKLSVSGPLKIIGSSTKTTSVKANSEARVKFKVYAKAKIGEAKVNTEVKALNEKFTEENDITVRPGTSLLKENGGGSIRAGESFTIDLGNDYIPSSASVKLILSKSPMVQFSEDLSYLVGYPHGCVEQTTSRAFPQLYFVDIMKSMKIEKMVNSNPSYNVQQAILKLQSMQMYSGGLSYWPGGSYVSWWGSTYATHFLIEAKRAGYDVDQRVLDKLVTYLRRQVKRRREFDYYYYDFDNIYRNRRVINKEVSYALYVLALVGEEDKPTMNYLKGNLNKLSLDSKYLLASSYLLTGDRATYQAILPRKFSGERSVKVSGGSFYSFIRDEAVALNALIEVDPTSPQIPQMARHLTKQMKKSRYLSTQERGFAMLALGKLAKKANSSKVTANITANGSSVGSFSGSDTKIYTKNLKGKNVKISVSGKGDLYYFWEIEGISKTGDYAQEDNVLQVRKRFFDRNGKMIMNNQFTQNDLIIVQIKLQTLDNSRIENVAVTDMLPASFEIENPRITKSPGTNWIRDASWSQHMDMRDDRINIFTDATGRPKTFYYAIRAVSTGNFQMGPVGADAMYQGEYHSYSGGGNVIVTEK